MTILEFIFSSFWTFAGTLVLIWSISWGISIVALALRGKGAKS